MQLKGVENYGLVDQGAGGVHAVHVGLSSDGSALLIGAAFKKEPKKKSKTSEAQE